MFLDSFLPFYIHRRSFGLKLRKGRLSLWFTIVQSNPYTTTAVMLMTTTMHVLKVFRSTMNKQNHVWVVCRRVLVFGTLILKNRCKFKNNFKGKTKRVNLRDWGLEQFTIKLTWEVRGRTHWAHLSQDEQFLSRKFYFCFLVSSRQSYF